MQLLSSLPSFSARFRRLREGLSRRRRSAAERAHSARAKLSLALRFPFRGFARRHDLPVRLIVSLTSYPPRFPTLALTLRCLLSQTIRPDALILWVGVDDAANLPPQVLELKTQGLEIRTTRDLGSFKKIIPALEAFPDAAIVTADDDLFYRWRWLEDLVCAARGAPKEIVCHRAHQIRLAGDGKPLPYREWTMESALQDNAGLLFPTGAAGVLYPPGALSPATLDIESFQKLCPRADDVWLYWMSRLAQTKVRNLATRQPLIAWRGSQDEALYNANVFEGQNDVQIRKMIEAFGWPPGCAAETTSLAS